MTADPAQSAPSTEPIVELRKALNCLYLAVDSSVADDVVRNVNIVLEHAALRTAQLAEELAEVTVDFQQASLGRDRWMARAETAESALRNVLVTHVYLKDHKLGL